VSQLIYANVDLSEVLTQSYAFDPVNDPTNTDYLWTRLSISVVSVVHSLWTATGKTPGGLVAGGNMGVPGDRMGVSLAKLPQILSQHRQTLLFRVGDDLVVESPPRLPDGTQLPCDCDNGPIVKGVKVLRVIGDTSAVVSFTVETYLNSCDKFVLSNRWGVHTSVDDCGYTTRTVRGRAIIRSDFANLYDLTADDFRQFLFVPADAPLRRVSVDVDLSEDGNTLDYTVVDKEVSWGLGENSPAVRVEGMASAGGHIDIPSLKEVVKKVPSLASEPALAFMTGGASLFRNVPEALNTVIPEGRCSAIVRVFGRKGADGKYLANVALHTGMAKFSANWLAKRAIIVGLHVTQSIGTEDEPWVELRLEFWCHHLLVSFIFNPTTIFEMMNWDVGVDDNTVTWDEGTTPALIGGSNNSRGAYVKQMVTQSLGGPCRLPDPPLAPGSEADAAGLA
jgi:hypothetical protein